MQSEPISSRLPKVQIWRRGCAFSIDALPVFLIGALLGGSWLVQLIIWFILRIVIVSRTQGQSFGRWAFDMRVVDERTGKTPGLLELFKREGLTGIGLIMAITGFTNLSPSTAQYMLLLLPVAIDCGVANFDPQLQQAFHDRIAGTMVIATRRGYSLDLKVKRWVAQLRRFVK